MDNVVGGSECSSGCESGWSLYLGKSWLSPSCYEAEDGARSEHMRSGRGEEEEDMSMVSDASSGPPLFVKSGFNFNPAAETGGAVLINNGGAALRSSPGSRKQGNKDDEKRSMMLDDTASSRPAVMLDFSHGFSTTQFLDLGPSAMDTNISKPSRYLGGSWMS